MILKTIVADDEKPSREALVKYLSDFCPDVEVVASCNSAQTAFTAIMKHNPHLVFLDIEMPGKNGFELLQMFEKITFRVVFITAYAEYAIKAFRFSATDYLLKPVMIDDLRSAVNKVKSEIATELDTLNLKKLIEYLTVRQDDFSQIVVSDSSGFRVLETGDIILCEADGYCTHFVIKGEGKITSSKNLKHYEELLTGHGFIRVHNSFLLNAKHIKSYSNQGEIILTQNISCPLGNAFKQKFMEQFKKRR
jgi:two-component system LytT family response regulator